MKVIKLSVETKIDEIKVANHHAQVPGCVFNGQIYKHVEGRRGRRNFDRNNIFPSQPMQPETDNPLIPIPSKGFMIDGLPIKNTLACQGKLDPHPGF